MLDDVLHWWTGRAWPHRRLVQPWLGVSAHFLLSWQRLTLSRLCLAHILLPSTCVSWLSGLAAHIALGQRIVACSLGLLLSPWLGAPNVHIGLVLKHCCSLRQYTCIESVCIECLPTGARPSRLHMFRVRSYLAEGAHSSRTSPMNRW